MEVLKVTETMEEVTVADTAALMATAAYLGMDKGYNHKTATN